MLEVIEAEARYDSSTDIVPALRGVSCTVHSGEIVAIVGANGSGKTTLGRLMCGMQISRSGMIRVEGHDPARGGEERFAVRRLVGFCRQNPADQLVSSNVHDEVAFGPRNLGLDGQGVEMRVGDALDRCGLAGLGSRGTATLSGGEQQRLAIAGVLAMHPRYLVLDEPTSQLDVGMRSRFRSIVDGLAHRDGMGIALITHDPLEVLLSDSVLVLDDGEVVWEGPAFDLLLFQRRLWNEVLLPDPYVEALRAAMEAGYAPKAVHPLPGPEDLAAWIVDHGIDVGRSAVSSGRAADHVPSVTQPSSVSSTCDIRGSGLELDGVSFSYGERQILDDFELEAHAGRVTLVAGPSGSGKSTIARLAAGLYEPDAGSVRLHGAAVRPGGVGLSFQNPEQQFFLDTVEDEIAFAPRNLGCSEEVTAGRVRRAAEAAGVGEGLLGRDPFALSGGQARRVAIASILSLDAGCYLFDEPTAGLDVQGRRYMHRLVRDLASAGAVIVVISHDVEEWAAMADDVVMLHEGRIEWSGPSSVLLEDPEPFEACGLEAPLGVRLNAALLAADAGGSR